MWPLYFINFENDQTISEQVDMRVLYYCPSSAPHAQEDSSFDRGFSVKAAFVLFLYQQINKRIVNLQL